MSGHLLPHASRPKVNGLVEHQSSRRLLAVRIIPREVMDNV